MKKKNYYLSFGVLLLFLTSCVSYHTEKGNEYYDHLNYAPSIKHFEKVYGKKHDAEIDLRLAEAYVKTNNLDSAEAKLGRIISARQVEPRVNFEYGKVLMSQGKHMAAVDQFDIYLNSFPTDATARMLRASCSSVFDRYRDTTLYELKPILEDQFVNTFSIVEYQSGAVFAADKEVFAGRKKNPWTGESYLDLYGMSKDNEGNWLNPELLKGDINGRFHEGPATFSKDGNTVYFSRSNYFKRKMVTNAEDENNIKIFKASLVNGEWKNLVEFPYNSDDYSCGHPTLSEDGQTMYFVSDMPGGFGGTDLYKSTLNSEGYWTTPVNLGSDLNTLGNEMFPYIHNDGSLYFSSDAHNSMGGLDVFITYFDGNRWMTPENLNYPLNSVKDDFGFSLNKDNVTGFVSSSRTKTDKMYSFEKNPPTFNMYGKARWKGTQNPVEGAVVEVTNSSTKTTIKLISDKDGKFQMLLSPEEDYHLLCTKEESFARTASISTKGLKYSEDFYVDFEVEKIIIDKPIVLENIYYDFDKWDIRPDAAVELDKLVKILNDNPALEIEMGSHTDARGSDQYNMVLSSKRANATVIYLESKGIDGSRLTWKGYGETMHVNKCKNGIECTEEEHQENRRTEFKVKKIRK